MSKQKNQNPFQIFSKLISLFLQGVISIFGRSLSSKSNFKLKKLQHKQIQKENQNIRKTRAVKLVRSLFTVIMTVVLTIGLSGINLWFTLPPIPLTLQTLAASKKLFGPTLTLLLSSPTKSQVIGSIYKPAA